MSSQAAEHIQVSTQLPDLKFRAFDQHNNEWVEFNKINDLSCYEVFNGRVQLLQHNDWIWQQYIGLKDTEHVEVYVGDIVTCEMGCPHAIEWRKEYGGANFGGMPAWYLSGLNNGYAWTGKEKIIGNIFDNPGLLK